MDDARLLHALFQRLVFPKIQSDGGSDGARGQTSSGQRSRGGQRNSRLEASSVEQRRQWRWIHAVYQIVYRGRPSGPSGGNRDSQESPDLGGSGSGGSGGGDRTPTSLLPLEGEEETAEMQAIQSALGGGGRDGIFTDRMRAAYFADGWHARFLRLLLRWAAHRRGLVGSRLGGGECDGECDGDGDGDFDPHPHPYPNDHEVDRCVMSMVRDRRGVVDALLVLVAGLGGGGPGPSSSSSSTSYLFYVLEELVVRRTSHRRRTHDTTKDTDTAVEDTDTTAEVSATAFLRQSLSLLLAQWWNDARTTTTTTLNTPLNMDPWLTALVSIPDRYAAFAHGHYGGGHGHHPAPLQHRSVLRSADAFATVLARALVEVVQQVQLPEHQHPEHPHPHPHAEQPHDTLLMLTLAARCYDRWFRVGWGRAVARVLLLDGDHEDDTPTTTKIPRMPEELFGRLSPATQHKLIGQLVEVSRELVFEREISVGSRNGRVMVVVVVVAIDQCFSTMLMTKYDAMTMTMTLTIMITIPPARRGRAVVRCTPGRRRTGGRGCMAVAQPARRRRRRRRRGRLASMP